MNASLQTNGGVLRERESPWRITLRYLQFVVVMVAAGGDATVYAAIPMWFTFWTDHLRKEWLAARSSPEGRKKHHGSS